MNHSITTQVWLGLALAVLLVRPATAEVRNLRLAPFFAAGDGVADDGPSLRKALADSKSGDIVMVPPGDYRVALKKGQQIRVPEGVTLLGMEGRSRLALDTDDPGGGHREFLRFQSGARMEGLTVTRNGAFPLVMFPLFGGTVDGVTVVNCTIDGNKEKFPEGYCHVFQVGVGTVENFTLRRCTVRNANYGLFQANSATGKVAGVLVEQCLFEANFSSDLEFNAPRGSMSGIAVRDCTFRNNRCRSAGAGFAVGFANVRDSSVENCTIRGYLSEALHVEDRSENIRLAGNTVIGGSTRQDNGVIMVLSDSRKINIEDNRIDARANENRPHLILVTAGGPKFANPSGVTVKGNVLLHGPMTRTWYLQPGSSAKPEGNVVVDFEG